MARAKAKEFTAQDTGAPSALAWIAKQEAEARADYESAKAILDEAIKCQRNPPPARDGEDWGEIVRNCSRNVDDALERCHKWQKSLREFDKSVAPEKRDASEKITREEGEKLLQLAVIYQRTALESLVTVFSQDVLACKTPANVYKLASDKFRETLTNALASAVRESHLPEWTKAAIESVL